MEAFSGTRFEFVDCGLVSIKTEVLEEEDLKDQSLLISTAIAVKTEEPLELSDVDPPTLRTQKEEDFKDLSILTSTATVVKTEEPLELPDVDPPTFRAEDQNLEDTWSDLSGEEFECRAPRCVSPKCKLFTCIMCKKVFYRKDGLISHQSLRHGSLLYPCETCGKMFSFSKRLRDHQREACGCKFLPRKRWVLRKRHNCSSCVESFFSIEELTRHQEKHSPFSTYHCDYCNSSWTTERSLNQHMLITHRDRKKDIKIVDNILFSTF